MTVPLPPAHCLHARWKFRPGFGLISLMTMRRALLLLISLYASTAAFGQAALPLYLNNLENTFQNWSWIPNNFADTNYVLAGFSNSISATANNNWQAISLGSDVVNAYQGMNLRAYWGVVFWARRRHRRPKTAGLSRELRRCSHRRHLRFAGIERGYLDAIHHSRFHHLSSGHDEHRSLHLSIDAHYGTTNTWYLADIYFTARPTPRPLVNLSVDASQTIRAADPRWFGVNTAIYDGNLDTSFTSNALAQAGLLSLRFPGGSESDDYNWATGTTGTNTWTWGTSFANFMHVFTNVPGAQAFITVNYGSGTSNEAAAWVLNANVTNHSGIKYWEIGNECYGIWEIDSNTPPWSAHTYATRFAGYYALMKAADPSIKIGAVAVAGEDSSANYTDYAATNPVTGRVHYGWTPVMLSTLKSLGVTPDFLIYHYYPEYSPQGDSDQLVLQVSSQLAGDAASLRYMLTNYLGASSTNANSASRKTTAKPTAARAPTWSTLPCMWPTPSAWS